MINCAGGRLIEISLRMTCKEFSGRICLDDDIKVKESKHDYSAALDAANSASDDIENLKKNLLSNIISAIKDDFKLEDCNNG